VCQSGSGTADDICLFPDCLWLRLACLSVWSVGACMVVVWEGLTGSLAAWMHAKVQKFPLRRNIQTADRTSEYLNLEYKYSRKRLYGRKNRFAGWP